MIEEVAMGGGTLTIVALLMVGSLFGLIYLQVSSRRSRIDKRLDELAGVEGSKLDEETVATMAKSALPKMGATLLPDDEEKRTRLQARLVAAGFYGREAILIFLGVKMLLMVSPAIIGLAAGIVELIDVKLGVILGALFGVFGMIGPSFWLDIRKKGRQLTFRRALPDALDVLVICLEGGLSLPGAIRRVSSELRTAHPVLAREMNIVQREIQLGRSTGDALRRFADRGDLEEIRSLASVIIQTERFGASLVKIGRAHV